MSIEHEKVSKEFSKICDVLNHARDSLSYEDYLEVLCDVQNEAVHRMYRWFHTLMAATKEKTDE